MSKRKIWWTLRHPDGGLDIDADRLLHLYPSKAAAERAALEFERKPTPIKIKLIPGDGK